MPTKIWLLNKHTMIHVMNFESTIMKSMIRTLTLATLVTLTPLAWSGEGSSCHFHGNKPAAESTIEQCANARRDLYLKNGTISETWRGISVSAIEIIKGKESDEWRVRYDNPNEPEKSKNKLYMFFSLPGNFIAANYSGK